MGCDKMEYLREGWEMIICDSVSIIDEVQDKLQEIGMKVEELEQCARKC